MKSKTKEQELGTIYEIGGTLFYHSLSNLKNAPKERNNLDRDMPDDLTKKLEIYSKNNPLSDDYQPQKPLKLKELIYKLNNPPVAILNDYHLPNRTGILGFFSLLNGRIGIRDRGSSDDKGKTINHEVGHNNNYSHIGVAIENAIRQDTGTVTYKHSPENHYSNFCYN
jgi:hypothetical protein